MAQKIVIPTRLELTKQKKRLLVARRGYKLLKDKRDEMMKQFLALVKITKQLRQKIDRSLENINKDMTSAESQMSPSELSIALMFSKERMKVNVGYKRILNLKIPHFTIGSSYNENVCPYGLALTYEGLDGIMKNLLETFKDMLKLAECESACRVLSIELQKSNRRVNALEHIVIPESSKAIKYITMKIEEQELSTAIRLLKVKDMMVTKK